MQLVLLDRDSLWLCPSLSLMDPTKYELVQLNNALPPSYIG
jgi:hypothetical protein